MFDYVCQERMSWVLKFDNIPVRQYLSEKLVLGLEFDKMAQDILELQFDNMAQDILGLGSTFETAGAVRGI